MEHIEFIKNSDYTLDELFDMFKTHYLTSRDWSEILELREGVLNFNSLYQILKKAITEYDKSIYVNSFYYNNKQYWLDKETRIGLFRLIDSGAKKITLQLEDIYVDIDADQLKEFLNQLEIYAGKCFSVTAKHLSTLKSLQSFDELLNYNYTRGYPDKISLYEN